MHNTAAFFNEKAAVWDELCFHDSNKIISMLEKLDIQPQARILDVGCGTGVLEPHLLASKPQQILAIDLAEQMIVHAQKKLTHPRVMFTCMDVFELHGQFDVICLYSVFPHFPDPAALFAKLSTLLAPSGKVMIFHSESKETINGYHNKNAASVSLGLPDIETLTVMMQPYVDVVAKEDTSSYYYIIGQKAR
ncbi:MAG: class I SAM-dependent methyltransferase [Erysipelotrichaceae bacterium]